ncbi:hypothetical protein HY090_02760 [Candidatus Kaiserbacteria bacterium]|nr:hypothetical protein [Candidatus Kaiserbacteria bacterium]
MKFPPHIPRGPAIFFAGIVIVIALISGYEFLSAGSGTSSTNTTARGNFFSALFPFGNNNTVAPGTASGSETPPLTTATEGAVPLLRQVSPAPVAGAWFAGGPASTSPSSIRYMERESGHIYETPVDSLTQTRISNTTIPAVEELYALSDSNVLVRSLDENGAVQNFSGVVNAQASAQSFNTLPLRHFDRVAVGSENILTVTAANGGARVELSKADGTKLQTLFASPISSWVPLMGGTRTFLETAPTAAGQGYLYELKNGSLQKIAGGIFGFVASVSPSGRYVAYSGNTPNGFAFSVLDTKDGTTFDSPVHAFAPTCAWIPNKEPMLFCAVPQTPAPVAYPDDWLLGGASFSDDAWIISPAKNTAYFIGSLSNDTGTVDAERVSISGDGSYGLFMNKKDLSLWSLKIDDVIARVPH